MARTFTELAEFIERKMRMSHVYQPVMLIELLVGGGSASVDDIAGALAAADRSQIEYYAQIVPRMPGPVLSRHGIVEKKGRRYRLVGFDDLTPDEVGVLVELCQRRLNQSCSGDLKGEALFVLSQLVKISLRSVKLDLRTQGLSAVAFRHRRGPAVSFVEVRQSWVRFGVQLGHRLGQQGG